MSDQQILDALIESGKRIYEGKVDADRSSYVTGMWLLEALERAVLAVLGVAAPVPMSNIAYYVVSLWMKSPARKVLFPTDTMSLDEFNMLTEYIVKAVGWPRYWDKSNCRTYNFLELCRFAQVSPDRESSLFESPDNGYAVRLPDQCYEFKYYPDAAMEIIEELGHGKA